MNVLLTGAMGMLGYDLASFLNTRHQVTCTDSEELDITNLHEVLSFTKKINPDIIINSAAYTNVDGCETHVDLAFKVNAIGAKNMAIASGNLNIPLIHFSTDYVFDGEGQTMYTEFDKPNPLSVYGKSKLAGENYVKEFSRKYFILRTQWLYGKNGKNFVDTIQKAAKEKGKLMVVNDQFGCPTYTKDLAVATEALMTSGHYGTYHVTNSGITTWYEFTREILNISGLEDVSLTPCTTEEYPTPAKRPAYSPLDNYCLRLIGYPALRNYKDALRDYLESKN